MMHGFDLEYYVVVHEAFNCIFSLVVECFSFFKCLCLGDLWNCCIMEAIRYIHDAHHDIFTSMIELDSRPSRDCRLVHKI
jgi:hypothetical protein